MTDKQDGKSRTQLGAVLVASGILLSRIFGLVRTRFQAGALGANNAAADSFALALRLPNFLQNLLGEGVLSASFIPAYSALIAKGDNERAGKLAGAVFSLLTLVTATLVAGGVLLAPVFVPLFTGGWTDEARALATRLVQIMFPGTGLLVLSAWCLAVLNSHRRFLLSYTAPVIWNVAIITFLIFGERRGGAVNDVALWAVLGAVVGAVLQFVVQLPAVFTLLRGFSMSVSHAREDVKEVATRFGPAVAARGSVQLSAYIDTIMIGAIQTPGLLSVLSYAQTLYQLPISLFGMSVSAAELPDISATEGEAEIAGPESPRALELRRRLGEALRRALYFALPSAVALAFFGDSIVALLWETGRFGRAEITATWVVLIGFAIGVVPATGGRIVATSFFAMRDTKTPLAFALARIFVGAFLSALMLFVLPGLLNPQLLVENPLWRAAGLSLGGAFAFWLEFGLLYSAFEARVGPPTARPGYTLKLLASVVIAAAAGLAVRSPISPDGPYEYIAVILAFGVSYVGMTALFGVAGLSAVAATLRRR